MNFPGADLQMSNNNNNNQNLSHDKLSSYKRCNQIDEISPVDDDDIQIIATKHASNHQTSPI